jgi:hypothetical protein
VTVKNKNKIDLKRNYVYILVMPWKSKEARNAAYHKKKEEDPEWYKRVQEQRKIYTANTKEAKKEYDKQYRENKKEVRAAQDKIYRGTEKGQRVRKINIWKFLGIKCDDFDALYDKYINTHQCERCECTITSGKGIIGKRHLDHNHKTGEFRQVVCGDCNINRIR